MYMLGPQPRSAVVLRLVPPPLPGDSEPQRSPAPEILAEMEAKLGEWLHSGHLEGYDSLRGACLEVLNRVNDFLGPYVTEASEGVREFLRLAELAEHAGKVVPLRPRA